VLLVPFVLLASHWLGWFELRRIAYARLAPIPEPVLEPPFAGRPFLRGAFGVLAVPHYWLAYLHQALVFPLTALITSVVGFTWITAALSFAATPALTPLGIGSFQGWLAELEGGERTAAIAGLTAVGLGMLALLPLVTRGLTWAHWGVDRLLLGRFTSEDLRSELVEVHDSRIAAVTAEDRALRRLERDIHDGPQQRLIRLQLDLASASRRLDDDPTAARELLDSSLGLAQETVDELRALTNGFAPPLLQDRGLAAALDSLAARSAVPVLATIDVPGALPGEVERGAYFVAAELLSNAAKHAQATGVKLDARLVADEVSRRTLALTVADDGRGGAAFVDGHGLAGMRERVRGLRGAMTLGTPTDAPSGTVVTVRIPVDGPGR
jgi:signal transduction histidine kinase